MTRVALISLTFDMAPLADRLRTDPDLDVALWPGEAIDDAEVAICWAPPAGIYAAMPKLRLIHGIAAGVDNLIHGQDTRDVPVCRVVDPEQARGMLHYVLWGVLHFHRYFDMVQGQQARQVWERHRQLAPGDCRIGIMGLGEIGKQVASGLARQGFDVAGWARSTQDVPGVEVFAGEASRADFLARTDILVCLLPLTPATVDILERGLFDGLPRGAALIHVGRGGHLVEADLLAALDSGQLRGAIVDVFRQEPLPPGHEFWLAPGLVVTPHMATMANLRCVREQIRANIAILQRGGSDFINLVDVGHGY